MSHLVQLQLATHAAIANMAPPDAGVFEGVVLSGSWEAAEGTCQVIIGETVGYESPFFNENGLNQPLMPVCRIINHAIGDQYGPVGGERAVIWEAQGGWVCKLVHGPDDSSPVPSGERWIQHRSQAAVVSGVQDAVESGNTDPAVPVEWDSALKLTNDGPTTGDMLGGAILGGRGALTQSQTASGARSTIDDTAQKIESVTAAGLTMGSYDQLKQIVHSVVAGQLETIIDGLAQKITHQASPTVKTIIDAAGNEIAHIVPDAAGGGKIGLGDLFDNLPAESGAINKDILSTFGGNVNTFGLANLVQFADLLHTAGTVTTPQLVTILTALIPAWIAKVAVPLGSPIVRIAS